MRNFPDSLWSQLHPENAHLNQENQMKTSKLLMLVVLALLVSLSGSSLAAVATSSFENWVYSYSLTPEVGEEVRSFKIYATIIECDPSHYYDRVMPEGWVFDTIVEKGMCVLTFYTTTGDALPVGVETVFAYTHYCAPCCNSWFLSDEGSLNATPNVIYSDDDSDIPCNIPPEFSDQCSGPGLLMAPIYPVSVDDETHDWGAVKSLYR